MDSTLPGKHSFLEVISDNICWLQRIYGTCGRPLLLIDVVVAQAIIDLITLVRRFRFCPIDVFNFQTLSLLDIWDQLSGLCALDVIDWVPIANEFRDWRRNNCK